MYVTRCSERETKRYEIAATTMVHLPPLYHIDRLSLVYILSQMTAAAAAAGATVVEAGVAGTFGRETGLALTAAQT